MARCASALCLVVAACALPGPPPPPPPAPPLPRAVTIPLVTDVNGEKSPIPLVRVRVAGIDTLFIVDTGSTHTVVTADFAAQSGLLPSPKPERGHGQGGDAATARAVPSLGVAVGSVEKTLTDALVVSGTDALTRLGIGGFLSPQTFFRQPVVLDLPRHALVLAGPDRAAALTWLAGEHGGEPSQAVPAEPGLEPQALVVKASLDDRPPVPCEVDTGGAVTAFLASYVATVPAPVAPNGAPTSGTDLAGTTLAGRSVTVGGMRVPGVETLAEARLSGVEGKLGMNVLRHFAILLPQANAPTFIFVRADT